MSFYNNKKPMVQEFWNYDVARLRAIAQDKFYTPATKRLATGIANQKDGLRRAPSIKENRAKLLNYIIFALKGQEGTLGSMFYRPHLGNTDLLREECLEMQAAIKNAKDAVTAALRCVEAISKAKSKKKQKKEKHDEQL